MRGAVTVLHIADVELRTVTRRQMQQQAAAAALLNLVPLSEHEDLIFQLSSNADERSWRGRSNLFLLDRPVLWKTGGRRTRETHGRTDRQTDSKRRESKINEILLDFDFRSKQADVEA